MRAPRDTSAPWLAGALVLAIAWWSAALGVLGTGVPDPLDDCWEYGVAAHALLDGEGFRTRVIHPPLWSLRDDGLTVPVLVHGPLIPLLLVPLIAAFGARVVDGIAWLGALAAVLAVVPLFRVAARRFGAPAGAAAAGLFTLAPLTLHSVNHDAGLLVGAALFAGALDLLDRERPRVFAGGALAGIAYLARPEMLLALPGFAILAGRRAPLLGAAFALPALAWWAHHIDAVGQPLFNLSSYLVIGYWGNHPEISVMRDFHLAPAAWPSALREALPSLPAKWADFFPHALKRALFAPTGATGWLAAIGVGVTLAGPARRAALAALLLAAVPVVVMTLTLYDVRYLMPFLPLWAIAAAAGAFALANRLPMWARRPRTVCGLLILLVLPSTAPALREAAAVAGAARAQLRDERIALAPSERTDENRSRPMFSDTPDFVAFTTGRSVVWVTRAEYERLPAARPAGEPAADLDLPVRGVPSDTWFHDADGRGGALPR